MTQKHNFGIPKQATKKGEMEVYEVVSSSRELDESLFNLDWFNQRCESDVERPETSDGCNYKISLTEASQHTENHICPVRGGNLYFKERVISLRRLFLKLKYWFILSEFLYIIYSKAEKQNANGDRKHYSMLINEHICEQWIIYYENK